MEEAEILSNRSLVNLLTIVIISSPCSSHPETTLIDKVMRSFSKFAGLDQCSIVVVLDGYVVRDTARTKKGQITDEMCEQYEAYHERLLLLHGGNSQIRIERSKHHLGFAMAVQFGLSLCKTTYAFVAQHDRVLLYPFHRLLDLIDLMGKNDHIRYIGFPTITNRTHDSVLNSRYQLPYLDTSSVKLNLGENLYLQPLIFWFDSQHLCHIERYLKIYKPYVSLPEEMKSWLGRKFVKKMVLRNGDFIEDRFGQSQRNCLTMKGKSDSFMLDAFRWFGTYLAWIPDEFAKTSIDGRGACVMVGHLRGRQLNPNKIEIYRAEVSRRLLKKKEDSEGYIECCEEFNDYELFNEEDETECNISDNTESDDDDHNNENNLDDNCIIDNDTNYININNENNEISNDDDYDDTGMNNINNNNTNNNDNNNNNNNNNNNSNNDNNNNNNDNDNIGTDSNDNHYDNYDTNFKCVN